MASNGGRARALVTNILLVGLLVVQGGLLAKTLRSGPATSPLPSNGPAPLAVGDIVASLSVVDVAGQPTSLQLQRADSRTTTVLVFHSECIHCQTVAPAWTEWTTGHQDSNIVLLARESLASAMAYYRFHAWEGRLAVVPNPERGTPEWIMTRRTPAIYAFDSAGTLVFAGHGSRLDELDEVLVSDE